MDAQLPRHGTRSKGLARATRVNTANNATHVANHLSSRLFLVLIIKLEEGRFFATTCTRLDMGSIDMPFDSTRSIRVTLLHWAWMLP
jgi:hypothetical protein